MPPKQLTRNSKLSEMRQSAVLYSILNVHQKYLTLADTIENRRGDKIFGNWYDRAKLTDPACPNPAEAVIKSMYKDNRTIGYLVDILDGLKLYSAADHIRVAMLGEEPPERILDPRPEQATGAHRYMHPGGLGNVPPVFQNTAVINARADAEGGINNLESKVGQQYGSEAEASCDSSSGNISVAEQNDEVDMLACQEYIYTNLTDELIPRKEMDEPPKDRPNSHSWITPEPRKEMDEPPKDRPNSHSRITPEPHDLPAFRRGSILSVAYQYLEHLTENFAWQNCLGSGGFADVYYAECTDGVEIAVKRLRESPGDITVKQKLTDRQYKAELENLKNYQHPNILPVLGYCAEPQRRCIIYEYAKNGCLKDQLRCSAPPLSVDIRVRVAVGVADALNFLHSSQSTPLIHRDVTSSNIMLDGYFTPLLGDFGQTKYGPNVASDKTHTAVSQAVGTQVYMDSEAAIFSSPKQDVYAYGMILLELLTGLKAFDDEREAEEKSLKIYVRENCDDIVQFITEVSNFSWPNNELTRDIYDVGWLCLENIRTRRPSMGDIIQRISGWSSLVLPSVVVAGLTLKSSVV